MTILLRYACDLDNNCMAAVILSTIDQIFT